MHGTVQLKKKQYHEYRGLRCIHCNDVVPTEWDAAMQEYKPCDGLPPRWVGWTYLFITLTWIGVFAYVIHLWVGSK